MDGLRIYTLMLQLLRKCRLVLMLMLRLKHLQQGGGLGNYTMDGNFAYEFIGLGTMDS
jgi:hypothetical protein